MSHNNFNECLSLRAPMYMALNAFGLLYWSALAKCSESDARVSKLLHHDRGTEWKNDILFWSFFFYYSSPCVTQKIILSARELFRSSPPPPSRVVASALQDHGEDFDVERRGRGADGRDGGRTASVRVRLRDSVSSAGSVVEWCVRRGRRWVGWVRVVGGM